MCPKEALTAITGSPCRALGLIGVNTKKGPTPACPINAIGGQNGFLSAALFLGGVLNIDRRPILSGVLIGLLTFKPHLGVVLPFALVALGAWRVIASAAVTALALFAAATPSSDWTPGATTSRWLVPTRPSCCASSRASTPP